MLSKINQIRENKLKLVNTIKKKQIDTENKLVVTSGKRGGTV